MPITFRSIATLALWGLLATSTDAQKIKVRNLTGFDFDKVIIYTERTEGRHIYPYNRLWGVSFDTPTITIDTIAFGPKIQLPGDGVYTLKFEADNYVACMCYGINTKKVKKIELTKESGVFLYSNVMNVAKHSDGTRITEPDLEHVEFLTTVGDNLYFEFVNNTPYTIYAINPKMSDEGHTRISLFMNDPDYRFLPGERRKISVIRDRLQESFANTSLTLNFTGVDVNSKQVTFKHYVKSYEDDIIELNETNIEITK